MESFEVVVVGAGVMGAATAWALGKAGIDAIVLEQFEQGHARGSSHGSTRVFRLAYDDPFHVALAQQSLPLWRELEQATGWQLLSITGGIDFGSPDYLFDAAAALHSCGAIGDILAADEVHERFPGIDYGREEALYSPDTGVLAAPRCVAGLIETSKLPVRSGARVDRLDLDHDAVTIATGDTTIRARRVVVTAGAWTGPMLESLGVDLPLQVTREQVFTFEGGGGMPVVIDRGDIFRYFIPPAHQSPGAKAGEHGSGERTTADERSYDVDPEGQARVCDWIGESFPGLLARPVAAETCLYTLTPDEEFIVDRVGPVVYASPCSGHGFKFAPILGEAFAAFALDREPSVDVGRYTAARFG